MSAYPINHNLGNVFSDGRPQRGQNATHNTVHKRGVWHKKTWKNCWNEEINLQQRTPVTMSMSVPYIPCKGGSNFLAPKTVKLNNKGLRAQPRNFNAIINHSVLQYESL